MPESNYIDTSMDYGLSDERIVLAVTSRIGTLSFMWRANTAARWAQRRRRAASEVRNFHPRERRGGCGTKPCADENRPLDVVQVPRFAIPTDLGAGGRARCSLRAQGELKEKGKVRFIGISGTLPHLMEFILRFTCTNPDLDTTIVGTIDPPHLRTNLDILQRGPLPLDLYEEAKHRLSPTGSAPQASGDIC
jgi:hypothetical protein